MHLPIYIRVPADCDNCAVTVQRDNDAGLLPSLAAHRCHCRLPSLVSAAYSGREMPQPASPRRQ